MQTRILTDKEYQQLRKDAKAEIPFAKITRSRRQYGKGEVEIDFKTSRYHNRFDQERIASVQRFMSKYALKGGDDYGFGGIKKLVQQYSLSDNKRTHFRVAEWNTQYVWRRGHRADGAYFDILDESQDNHKMHKQLAEIGMGL